LVPRANLRDNTAGIDQKPLEGCLEAVEAPVSRREENALRAVCEREHPGRGARAQALAEEVERLGLQPSVPPPPLDPIRSEDVYLGCWLLSGQEVPLGFDHGTVGRAA
jgi:hypothetical protein